MRNGLKWFLAIVLTLAAATYQRMTGPTYPKKVEVTINTVDYKFKLPRSHSGFSDQAIVLIIPDTSIKGTLHFRRFKMNEQWTIVPLVRSKDSLKARLPAQPAAGKLEYFITLQTDQKQFTIPSKSAVVIRFKGAVPLGILIPHILLMFLSLLFGMFVLIETLTNGPQIKTFTWVTTITLFLGGMILGPLVQKFAFGALWTGIPFGWDLTDNKTLIAMLFWLLASWQVWKKELHKAKLWVILAVVVMFAVYMIPHSVMGSELNYQTMTVETGNL